MNEREFLQTLQHRAKEQEMLMSNVPFPKVFSVISLWLGEQPWRLIIPISFLLSLFLHLLFGTGYDTLMYKIFGGFGLIHL